MTEKMKITNRQLMYSTACFMLASALITGYSSGIMVHDAWLGILVAVVFAVPMLLIYFAIAAKFPGKNLAEINDEVFGKVIGKAVSLLYLFFFLNLTTLNLNDVGVLMKQNIMHETPIVVLVTAMAIVCVWAARAGIKTVIKYSEAFFFVAALLTLVVTLITLNKVKWDVFLPIMDVDIIDFAQGTNLILAVPMLELCTYLVIMPNLHGPVRVSRKYMLGGFFIGAAFMLMIVFTDIAILGNTLPYFSLPSFETLRIISFSPTSRMEVFFAIVLVFLLFLKIAFLLYVTSIFFSQMFGFKTYRPFVLAIAALAVVYRFFVMPYSPSGYDNALVSRISILWLLFEMVLPVLTLITACIRKQPRVQAAQPIKEAQ